MTDEGMLIREKLDQVPAILEEHDIDLWLTFVHETQVTPDPCIELIVGTHCTWQSAFLLSRSGERMAIVGRFDAPGLVQAGGYSDIVTYDESVRPVLRQAIERLDPQSIALNYAPSDPAADGLTHGLWLVLRETLEGTPYADRLVLVRAGRQLSARPQDVLRDRAHPRRDRRDGGDLRARPGADRARA